MRVAARTRLELRAPVWTGIEEDTHAIVIGMEDQDRRLADLQSLEVAFAGNFRKVRERVPFAAVEDALELRVVHVAAMKDVLGKRVEFSGPSHGNVIGER